MKDFKAFFLLAVFLCAPLSWSREAAILTLKSQDNKTWSFFLKDSWRVSQDCLVTSCLALKIVESRTSSSSKDKKYVGHPAAKFCEEQGGTYVVGEDKNLDEDGICTFKDQSYILGWDYFKRNHPKKADQ